ncbi:RseA family anti-sigma factor [Melaminivora sp.]|uniref:sigma-E factor negative regulatory protein n=1 Tax=Melaminivora sp. TaxID=1933032 RepID=UPI0028AF74E5|nr:RseA family anti-sigma factor [Melaminivora sp.]
MNDHEQDFLKMREQLSALADGELQGEDFARAVQLSADAQGRECWQLYHLIGDALRQCDTVRADVDGTLLQRLRQQMDAEGAPPRTLAQAPLRQVAPAPAPGVPDPAANAQLMRWKLVAGFASLAAVAVLGWNVAGGRAADEGGAPQLASAAAPPPDAQQPQQRMLRDPRLDELLAAHRQLGNNTNTLQMPAGFLRNASFAGHER